jgi:hypothetical protein
MSRLIWIFLRNVFETITFRNFKKMDAISMDHDLKLEKDSADPVIAVIYAAFHPLRVIFHTCYTVWIAAIAEREGATQKVQELIKLLCSQKIEEWDIKIQNVYRQGNYNYKKLLPNFRMPFQNGSYAERITQVEGLLLNIGTDPGLAAVAADINDFLTEYYQANSAQSGAKHAVKTRATELRVARKNVAAALYKNLGYLIYNYGDSPEVIGNYFDLEKIRSSVPKSEGGTSDELVIHVPPAKSVECGFSFEDTGKILVYNSSDEDIYIYKAATPYEFNITADAKVVNPDEEKEFLLSDLGANGLRYLFAANKGSTEADITISLV